MNVKLSFFFHFKCFAAIAMTGYQRNVSYDLKRTVIANRIPAEKKAVKQSYRAVRWNVFPEITSAATDRHCEPPTAEIKAVKQS
jgi:hypothetical protein